MNQNKSLKVIKECRSPSSCTSLFEISIEAKADALLSKQILDLDIRKLGNFECIDLKSHCGSFYSLCFPGIYPAKQYPTY